MLDWPSKDPDEVLDYSLDWAPRLIDDTISTSLFIIPDGIVADSSSNSPTETIVWLSGGTLGATYTITNRVVTAQGRTMDQTVRLRIRAR